MKITKEEILSLIENIKQEDDLYIINQLLDELKEVINTLMSDITSDKVVE